MFPLTATTKALRKKCFFIKLIIIFCHKKPTSQSLDFWSDFWGAGLLACHFWVYLSVIDVPSMDVRVVEPADGVLKILPEPYVPSSSDEEPVFVSLSDDELSLS